jgi:ligand-binding sensor domain-containing protein/signal transduction histidine kinase
MKILYMLRLFTLTTSLCFGQDNLMFERLTMKDGLSPTHVTSIFQDRDGFMWFGTPFGLYKYDGYEFIAYQHDPRDVKHSLGHNNFRGFAEGSTGPLWVITFGGGLYAFDKRTGQFTAYRVGTREISNRDECNNICLDKHGRVWISSQGGIQVFNPETKQFRLYPAIANTTRKSIAVDAFGSIWLGTSRGLFQFDEQSGQYSNVRLPDYAPDQQPVIQTVLADSDGAVWMLAQPGGLYRMDVRQQQIRRCASPANTLAKYELTNLLCRDDSGNVWVGTASGGLVYYNPKYNQVVSLPTGGQQPGQLDGNRIIAVFRDRSHMLWVSTENGIYKASGLPPKFVTIQIKPSFSTLRIPENNIAALLEDRQGYIWLGTNGKGLYKYDRRTKAFSNYQSGLTQGSGLLSNQVQALCEDSSGNLWIGTPEGINRLDRSTGRITGYPYKMDYAGLLKADSKGQLWYSGWAGFVRFDTHTNRYEDVGKTLNLPYYGVAFTDILISRGGELWFATASVGLIKLKPATGKLSHYQPDFMHPEGHIPDKDIRTLYEDNAGILWLGTNQAGLTRFDPRTETFTLFTTRDGLPNNFVSNILPDQDGNLWLTTANGLCRFNPKTKAVQNFSDSDGLQSNRFSPQCTVTHQGELLVGGPNGFNIINPRQIQDNSSASPVYITGLRIENKPRQLDKNRIELKHDENMLSFQFVELNYNRPERNQYAYQLVGVNQDWVHSGHQRVATYIEVPPGTYTFRVKAANDDGIWNPKFASLTVIIHPPWWRTWWAYCLYVLLLLGSVWGLIQYRSRALRRENRLLEKKVVERTEQIQHQKEEIETQRDNLEQTLTELKATQNQLIQKEKMASLGELTAGIAHEIQNPLNFVNNFAEVSVEMADELQASVQSGDMATVTDLSSELRNNMNYIVQNGQRAAGIVRSMLEHSRSSTGERRPANLNELADEYLKLAFHGMRAKDPDFQVQLCTEFDQELKPITVAPQDIGRVLLNLYNNAFYAVRQKHQLGQKIVIAGAVKQTDTDYQPTVWMSTRQVNGQIKLCVKDNGIGIPAAIIDKIYQPFFTTKPTGQGTGLGLSLSYDIITKGHGGDMRVESREGEGTEFIISLPLI